MTFPMTNVLGSLQIYHFPHFLAKEIKNASLASRITRQKDIFKNCAFRFDCFHCLSTVTFFMSDLPLIQNRIKIRVNLQHFVPTAKLANTLNSKYMVLDFLQNEKRVMPPKQLIKFEQQAKKDIDYCQDISHRIGPVKLLTKNVITNLCGTKNPPNDVLYFYTKSRPDQDISKKFYGEVFHTQMIDECERKKANKNCLVSGHRAFKELKDKIRSCEHCAYVFGHDKYTQVQRTRNFVDPILHSCMTIMQK